MNKIIVGVIAGFALVGVAHAAGVLQIGQKDQFAFINTSRTDAEVYRVVDSEFKNVCYYFTYAEFPYADVECVHGE